MATRSPRSTPADCKARPNWLDAASHSANVSWSPSRTRKPTSLGWWAAISRSWSTSRCPGSALKGAPPSAAARDRALAFSLVRSLSLAHVPSWHHPRRAVRPAHSRRRDSPVLGCGERAAPADQALRILWSGPSLSASVLPVLLEHPGGVGASPRHGDRLHVLGGAQERPAPVPRAGAVRGGDRRARRGA